VPATKFVLCTSSPESKLTTTCRVISVPFVEFSIDGADPSAIMLHLSYMKSAFGHGQCANPRGEFLQNFENQ